MTASNSDLIKLVFKPGIDKNVTTYAAEGLYTSCDKIRFRYGLPEKMGGWVAETTDGLFVGVSRDIESFADLDGTKYLAVGTNSKLELFTGGEIYDITPIRASANLVSAVNTLSGSPLVTICAASNDTSAGDFVLLSAATSAGGIILQGDYEVVCAGVDYFVVSAANAATSTVSAAVSSLNVDYLLYTGLQSNGVAFGWGAGTWGSGTWGTARGAGGVSTALRQWSLVTWGEDLIANPRGGEIYIWAASAGPDVRATVISAAPSATNFILLAQPARHLVAFGTNSAISGVFDPLLIRWSASENYNDFIASAGNDAGSYRLTGGNEIITAVPTRRDILVLTDLTAYSMQYLAAEPWFGFDQMGENCGAISEHCAVDVNGVSYWMGQENFYRYDGAVNVLPCSLQRFIFDQLEDGAYNQNQKEKIFAGTNQSYNEIIWLYPDKTSDEINRYVIYNYLEDSWYHGFIDRTVWQDVDVFDKPYAINAAGQLYVQETGYNDDAGPLKATLNVSYFDIGDGEQLAFLDKFIPDATVQREYNVQITTKKYPNAPEVTKGPFVATTSTDKISIRARGRQAAVRYSCSATGSWFRLGAPRITLKPDGGR